MEKTEKCKACKYYGQPLVPTWPVKNPELIVIGEAPGEDEVRSGIPFTGVSGQKLRKALRDTGFDMSKIAITNVCKCHPPENETPKEADIKLCTEQFLFAELEEMRPQGILCAGATANTVFSDKKLRESLGEAREYSFSAVGVPKAKLLTTYHPAFILRSPEAEPRFRRDLKQMHNLLYPTVYERRLVVVDTLEGLAEVKAWIAGKTIVGSDIETNMTLDPFEVNSRIVCISFGDDQVAYSVSLDKDADAKYTEQAAAFVRAALDNPQLTHIFHRCWFDTKFLESRGIKTRKYTDTRIKAFLLNENRMVYGLKELASEYIGEYLYAITENDRHKFGLYNCEDAWFTYKLNEMFDKDMTPALHKVMNRIILPAIPVLNEMMLTGMELDVPYAKKLEAELTAEREKVHKHLMKEHKEFKDVNLASPKQMQQVIFKTLKMKPLKETKTGYSVDAETLGAYAYKGKDWARKILKIRSLDKLLSTYVTKIPTLLNADGRIRTQFDPCGTVTGRPSSSEPNLQNIPRQDRIYRMFVASKGKRFFYFDFSQIELRVGCSIAREPKMIHAFNNPVDEAGNKVDLHIRTAALVTGKKPGKITKEERQLAKGVNFGLLYGQGAEGLKQYLFDKFETDIALSEAERIRNLYFQNYSGLNMWYVRVRSEIARTGEIIYPTGRIRRFPHAKGMGQIPGDVFRQGVNSPVQGSASDIMMFALSNLHRLIQKRKMPAKFVLTVHDSAMLEIEDSQTLSDDLVDLVTLVIKEIIPNDELFSWLRVPLEAEIKTGPNWGELQ